ncbi:MAG: FecR family protein, partial [Planctomycetota bacterium]
ALTPEDLKKRILAGARPAPRRFSAMIWQGAAAAAVLLLLAYLVLAPSPSPVTLVKGTVTTQDGSQLHAPAYIDSSRGWALTAQEDASLRLPDGTAVEADRGVSLALRPGGPRGVVVELVSGRIRVSVPESPDRMLILSPMGSAETSHAELSIETLKPEGGEPMRGVLVTAVAGTILLAGPMGTMDLYGSETAVLSSSAAPLLTAQDQDDLKDLLKRIEELTAAIEKLTQEIAKLEAANRKLNGQLNQRPPYSGGTYPGQKRPKPKAPGNSGGTQGQPNQQKPRSSGGAPGNR